MFLPTSCDYRRLLYADAELGRSWVRLHLPEDHTMKVEPYRQYIGRAGVKGWSLDGKKFSVEQGEMIAAAYRDGINITVISAYRKDFGYICERNQATIVGPVVEHVKRSGVGRPFNRLRQCMARVRLRDGCCELWVLVFPSSSYVDQVAELLAAIVNDYRSDEATLVESDTQVTVCHFQEIEAKVAVWTGFTDFVRMHVRHGDVVVLGNIDLMTDGIREFAFSPLKDTYSLGGLDDMFGVKAFLNEKSHTRLVCVGVSESYWGEASGQLAAALAEIGAGHILYGSKAATMQRPTDINTVYAPTEFRLVRADGGSEKINYTRTQTGDYMKRFEVHEDVGAVTVPTVMGETWEQRNRLRLTNTACMDCENGHIAQAVAQYNARLTKGRSKLVASGFGVHFVPIHFITDYIYNEHEEVGPDNNHLGQAAEEKARNEAFNAIGGTFAVYGLTFGVGDPGIRVDKIASHHSPDEPSLSDAALKVRPLLNAGLAKVALSEVANNQPDESHGIVSCLLHAIIAQKYGYISSARSAIRLLMRQDIQKVLSSQLAARVDVVRLKMYSQVGSSSRVKSMLDVFSERHGVDVLQAIDQYGAVQRRGAVLHAMLGEREKAAEYIGLAKQLERSDDVHYDQTNALFEILVDLPTVGRLGIRDVRGKLSEIRVAYLRAAKHGRWWQTHFEKCSLAALFLEATYLLSSRGSTESVKDGIRLLTAGHLLNRRFGGNETSETYGEIVALAPTPRVRNLVSLAMREDRAGRERFLTWAHDASDNFVRLAGTCMEILREPVEHREHALQDLLQRPHKSVEQVVVVDKYDNLRRATTRDVVVRDGLWRRASGGFVVDPWRSLVLCHKRSIEKDERAGVWVATFGGKVNPLEDTLRGALRELAEELGIYAQHSAVMYAGKARCEGRRQFEYVYIVCADSASTKVCSEPAEVSGHEWVSISAVLQNLRSGEGWFEYGYEFDVLRHIAAADGALEIEGDGPYGNGNCEFRAEATMVEDISKWLSRHRERSD